MFKYLFEYTVKHCLDPEKFFFDKYNSDYFNKHLISTGDGGFLIMDNPLQCLLFAILFETNLRAYNSYSYFPKLRDYIGELSLRYTITYDKMFKFENNFYGPAIINNARILSKDKLNRCLLDQNTNNWFLKKTYGIETLCILNKKEILKISDFSTLNSEHHSLLFDHLFGFSPIRHIDISKLSPIEAKDSFFDVFNLHIQVDMTLADSDNMTERKKRFILTLGNVNTEGINI